MRILVADDELEMTMVLEAVLRREHYSVDVVHNGQDALDYGLTGNYDCLILDIMMPGLDGIQVLQALRTGNISTPVLLLTAKSQIEDRVIGLESGADDYLPKPFDNREFILIAMLSLTGTVAVLCTAISVGNHYVVADRADRGIDLLYQNHGEFPTPDASVHPAAAFRFQVTMEAPFETRYFIAEITEHQEIKSVDTEHIAALDRQTVVESINQIMYSGKNCGYVDYYRFKVFQNEDGGSTIIVLDCFLQLQAAYNMLRITLIVSASCVLIVFILLLFFSGKAIRPFVENLERQRQFVTDASHELKTPLAILSANVGLLEDTYGKNKWLESARTQVFRLDKLIKNLVELARTEETDREEHISSFSVSETAQASADAFQPVAESDGKTLTVEIGTGICQRGVQDNLFRLFTILLDNAVKYCVPGGEIYFSLSQRGRKICITVSNPCAGLDPSLLPRYFDRFYRVDSSRARSTGGMELACLLPERLLSGITDIFQIVTRMER